MPALDAFDAAIGDGSSFADALRASANAAEEGMKATIPLVARKGRASYLGERSAGHQDPGATSSYLLLRTAADAFAA
jgi:phosphoenolpyruvate---glycerone phosphotransferase subunit DhaL